MSIGFSEGFLGLDDEHFRVFFGLFGMPVVQTCVFVFLWKGCEGSQPFVCGVSGPYVGEPSCFMSSGRGLECSWCDGRAKWVDGQWVVTL